MTSQLELAFSVSKLKTRAAAPRIRQLNAVAPINTEVRPLNRFILLNADIRTLRADGHSRPVTMHEALYYDTTSLYHDSHGPVVRGSSLFDPARAVNHNMLPADSRALWGPT